MNVAKLNAAVMRMMADHLSGLSDEPSGFPGLWIRRHVSLRKAPEPISDGTSPSLGGSQTIILIWVAGTPATCGTKKRSKD